MCVLCLCVCMSGRLTVCRFSRVGWGGAVVSRDCVGQPCACVSTVVPVSDMMSVSVAGVSVDQHQCVQAAYVTESVRACVLPTKNSSISGTAVRVKTPSKSVVPVQVINYKI